MNSNPFLSRFASDPVLVAEDQSERFSACLAAAVAHPDYAEICRHEAGESASNLDGFWPEAGSWLSRYRPYIVSNGVLQIPVSGVLMDSFGYSVAGYVTGYTYIRRAFERGMADPQVRGIALVINSPGGAVAGNFDLVDAMYAQRGKKPIRAYAAESAYSAAYSIASVADKIIVSRTGGVGSIGVVTMHVDYSEAMKESGVKVTFIHFGKHKVEGNGYEPLSAEAKARMQSRIDALGEIFVATVARNRSMDSKDVRATEALTYMAADSVSIGLADAIGQFDDAVAAFAAELSEPQEIAMGQNTGTAAVDQAAVDAARAEGVTAGKTEGKVEGLKEGATAERGRISAILALDEAKNRRESALTLALSGELSVDTAKAVLAGLPEAKPAEAAPKGNKQLFEAAMSNGNPSLGSGDETDEDPDSADSILASARMVGVPGLRAKR